MDRLRVTKERLEKDVASCGLHAGDTVLMHSGLKAIGFVEGGPDVVIDVLLAQLGPNGTLMVPAFTYSYAGRTATIPFDVKTTPGSRNGAIADRVRERPETVRSAHPSHSFAAIGRNAHFLCDDHQLEHAVSEPSPLTRLIALDGRIFFLGCGVESNVMLHLAEAMACFRYDHIPFSPQWGEEYLIASPDGPIRAHVSEHPGCDIRFPIVADKLMMEGRGIRSSVGMAQTFLFNAKDILETGLQMLNENPDILLCHQPHCEACEPRRKYLKGIGAI